MNMKKILVVALCLLSYFAYAQPGSLSQSVYRSRVLDSAAAISANVSPIAAGYAPFYWNAQATVPGWRVWNGTSYDIGFSSGGNFWKNAGTTNLTSDAIVDNGAHNLLMGDITGPYSSWDIDGAGPLAIPNSRTDGVGDPASATHSYIRHAISGGDSEAFISVKNSTGSEVSYITVSASATPAVVFGTTGIIEFQTNGVERFHIEADGSWDLGPTNDPGISGYYLQSNGAGAAPTWVPGVTNTSSALTDGAAITITGPKHTLTSTQATITWTLSQTQDFQTTDIILNATSTTWTFPAGALCVVDGVASGTNTAALSGVSGDHHIMSIYKDGTNYRVAIKNFEQ